MALFMVDIQVTDNNLGRTVRLRKEIEAPTATEAAKKLAEEV